MPDETKCRTCTRVIWDGGHALDDDECATEKDYSCRVTADKNKLIAALHSVIKLAHKREFTADDRAILRTAMVIGEEARPSSRHCPKCGKIEVVRRGEVTPHYANHADTKLCPASNHAILMGVMMEKGPVAG